MVNSNISAIRSAMGGGPAFANGIVTNPQLVTVTSGGLSEGWLGLRNGIPSDALWQKFMQDVMTSQSQNWTTEGLAYYDDTPFGDRD